MKLIEKMPNKVDRRRRQIMRAEIIDFILMCYDPFSMMKIQTGCMKHQLSYSDAKKQANMFSEIFKLECNPTDLIDTSDNMSNKIIDNYEKLEEYLKHINLRGYPFTKEDMMSFMEYEYHNNVLLNMRHLEWSHFSCYCMLAAKRIYNVEDIIPKCIEIQIWNGGSLRQVDTKLFRRHFIRLEQDFWNIIAKRIVRSRKKQK